MSCTFAQSDLVREEEEEDWLAFVFRFSNVALMSETDPARTCRDLKITHKPDHSERARFRRVFHTETRCIFFVYLFIYFFVPARRILSPTGLFKLPNATRP